MKRIFEIIETGIMDSYDMSEIKGGCVIDNVCGAKICGADCPQLCGGKVVFETSILTNSLLVISDVSFTVPRYPNSEISPVLQESLTI